MEANRQTKYGAYASVYTLVILGVLGAINYLASENNKSYDATANKRYTLSEQTSKIVKGLNGEVRLTYWDKTDNFPRAKDLLERYAQLSSKLKVEYIDPDKKPGLAREAGLTQAGIMTLISGMKREEARELTEEAITGAIIRVIKDKVRMVCFTTGAGEAAVDSSDASGLTALKDLLEKDNYKTQVINLVEQAQIPETCTVTVVAGPRFDMTKPSVDALKAKVESGGRVMFLLDAPLQMGKSPIAPNKELAAVLAGWGVTANEDLVIDSSGIGQLMGMSAAAPIVSKFTSHPIVREFNNTRASAAMLLARSLDVKNSDKTTVEALYSSSTRSFATANLKAAEIQEDPEKDKKGPLTLAAAGSYKLEQDNKQGRFVVVGSAGFAGNRMIGFQLNRDLAINMVAWLASDEDLISIRPKDPEDRRLQLNSGQILTIRLVSQFILPLIVIVAGVFVWWKRR
jgi:ABC-type uncharacterized transport system involved in gliding motility auxiliary subunit